MLITYEELHKINLIQIDILRSVAEACRKMDIPFFMVHGSLLGTVRDGSFVRGDDDIDIAMKRADYERFVREAPAYLPQRYFVQTNQTDPAYPLEFAKIRDSETTYVIDVTRDLNIHHGIYIDLFPIDSCEDASSIGLMEKKYKLMNLRLTSVLNLGSVSLKRKAARFAAKMLYPSYKKTVAKREHLLTSGTDHDRLRMTGGKPKEHRMPAEWFRDALPAEFEGVPVFIPNGCDAYLRKIYGDYENRTLIENKRSDEERIEINACRFDVAHSYRE